MPIAIGKDDPERPDVSELLRAHLANSARHSPPESNHTLDVRSLRAPEITFWTARNGAALLGCGALKELDRGHGEIKSMHTAEAYRGRGVGGRIVAHIIAEARRRRYDRLSLETGSQAVFAPARALYARHGFTVCGPFADYKEDPHSRFMTLDLTV